MDPSCRAATLGEMRLFVSGAQYAHGARTGTTSHATNRTSTNLVEVMLAVSAVLVQTIGAADVVKVMIKQASVMAQIKDERARLRTSTLCSTESARVGRVILSIEQISLIVITPSFLRDGVVSEGEKISSMTIDLG